MQIYILIEEVKGGWLISGNVIDVPTVEGSIKLDRASAATEKQIPARIKDIITPFFAEMKT